MFATRHTHLRRTFLQLWRMGRQHGHAMPRMVSRVDSALAALPSISKYLTDLVW